jgi:hypothetical protein
MVIVRTGASNLSDTMILEGLTEGDMVITGPYRVLERLKDGDKVREEVAKDAVNADGASESGAAEKSDA